MPKVLPSEVVAFINEQFPGDSHGLVTANQAPAYATIVRLVDDIPPELITLSGSEYQDLIIGVEYLRHVVELFATRGNTTAPQGGPRGNPIVLIRKALANCLDQRPSPATAGLLFITNADLRESIRLDISSAHSAYRNGEWKAATVLAGAAMEALLLWGIETKTQAEIDNAVDALLALPTGGLDDRPKGKPVKWRLFELIKVAKQLGLLKKQRSETQCDLARDYRNLIHPGKERTDQPCDRATALGALAGCEIAARDLS
jgi:hypothetical protein